ncbi:MAG: hypothetical protein CM15mP103_00750 [Gammaproteobacteria bacterium]|nr:MAG: hypothetical protein CM15mP103_00750 [Gammaproteobacteria bacterium]
MASSGIYGPSTYEQYGADRDAVGESEKWLKEQERYEITLYNGTPLASHRPTSSSWKSPKPTRA